MPQTKSPPPGARRGRRPRTSAEAAAPATLLMAGLALQACGGSGGSGSGSGTGSGTGTGSGGTSSGGTGGTTHSISTTPMAAPAPGTTLTITRTGGSYTLAGPGNFALAPTAGARLEVADAIGNGYAITLVASGTGTLEVDFVDAGDTMTLEAGSTLSGFTLLRVRDGTLDVTDADLGTVARVEVASGIRLSVPQLRTIPTLYTAAEDGRFVIEVASTSEAEELRTLLSSDSLLLYGGTVDLVTAPSASITPLALNAYEVEAASFVRDPDAPPPGALLLNPDRAGNVALGTGFGDITVTQEGTRYVFTPATGGADRIEAADVGSIVVTGRTLTGDAVVLDEETVTGSGNVVITRTFSKIHGLGGLRIGWGFGPAEVIGVLDRIRGPFNLSGPALAAAEAAMRDTAHRAFCKAENARLRGWLAARLAACGVPSDPSQGNFILARFADAAEAEAADAHLRAAGIIVRRVAGYGLPEALRITIGREEDCARVAAAVADFMRGRR